jgi:3-isopropylmalate/(R)-2-methylmalate dehydratase small subunit
MSLPAPSTIIRGRTWVWPDDVNTDIIIPFRFKARTNDPVEMAKYAMYGFDPEFYKKVKPGDLFVAGRNFGGGSSREQAPVAIKYSGIAAVVAESFARRGMQIARKLQLPHMSTQLGPAQASHWILQKR